MRPIGQDTISQIEKSLSLLREPLHGLGRAADWLEAWVNHDLPVCPLLAVDASLAIEYH